MLSPSQSAQALRSSDPDGLVKDLLHNFDKIYVDSTKKRVKEEVFESLRKVRGREKRLDCLRFGLVDSLCEVPMFFKDAVERYSNYWQVFFSYDGDGNFVDSMAIPSKSRWNLRHSGYRRMVAKKFGREFRDLKKATLVTLTYDPKKIENPYLFLSDIGFLVLKCWSDLKKFLDRLRRYRERVNLKWNYITTVLEFQKNGMVHFHLLFVGSWVAPLSQLQRYWEYSEPQGVDVSVIDGLNVVGYVVKYLSKARACVREVGGEIKKVHEGYMWLYFFAVRLYNCRHHIRRLRVVSNWQCVGLVWVSGGKWNGQVDIIFKRFDDNYGESEDKWWDTS